MRSPEASVFLRKALAYLCADHPSNHPPPAPSSFSYPVSTQQVVEAAQRERRLASSRHPLVSLSSLWTSSSCSLCGTQTRMASITPVLCPLPPCTAMPGGLFMTREMVVLVHDALVQALQQRRGRYARLGS